MSKVLKKSEIKELFDLFIEIHKFYNSLIMKNELARHINLPKTPSKLTESLAYYLILEKKILEKVFFKEINLGGKIADLLGKNELNREYKIEIKATKKSFQYFGNKDITCDILIWINIEN